jgi:gluconolactonase
MKINKIDIVVILTTLLISGINGQGQSDNKTVSFESNMQKLADGFKFTEGPASDEEGNIYFTDIPNSRIHKWSVDGKLSIFLENTGKANGLFFDKNGNLIACAGGAGKLVSIDSKGKITVLAGSFEGKPFNSPNDLWMDPKGGIYFTDPRYGSRDNLPQNGEHVYYLSADRKKLIRVINDMVRPNGLIGTPDGKLLYVADHGANKTYFCKINPDGTLSDKKLFAEQGSDGMTLDSNGNLYLTAQTVTIYAPSGKLIKTIEVPERPSNVCFGGENKKILFITARTSLYSINMQSKFYSFTMTDIDGEAVPLSQYQGKVLLIVNVASKCGFTKQYAGLQQLYEKYKEQGFVILGFPANNFFSQEPGTDSEIKTFCSIKFNVTFPMFSKISVKGRGIHPLYQYLTSPEENGEFGRPIKWNFNKFLIDKDGKTIAYFPSKVDPLDPEIINAVEKALNGKDKIVDYNKETVSD